MKKFSILILTFLSTGLLLSAQVAPNKYYVQFTDKDNSPYSINNPEVYLTQRSIDRRTAHNIPIDMKDIPVNPQYISGVRQLGGIILNPTKWLNGVVIYTENPAVLADIENLPYVSEIKKGKVKGAGNKFEKSFFENESYDVITSTEGQLKNTTAYDYGNGFNQINQIKGDQLHEQGFDGKGMIIGVLDSGFENADEIAVFDSLWNNGQILGTKDVVAGGEVQFDKHFHGTMVLSTMGGNYPGELVGTAPKASYYLIRTEDAASEYLIEEYNWVSGAEFADSLGCDVLNTSLGYSDFNDPSQDHTYADMDGNTTPITIGSDIAASRGMLVVNSAGNSGEAAWYYITAPADGDSVFAIGAVDAIGQPAGFSGHGPTYDGRLKPNASAQGVGAYVANTDGNFIYGNGTSFSSPIMAGMMACLWQANPDMNNMELINAVMQSSSMANNPDNKIGYGIPDFIAADDYLGIIEQDGNTLFTEAHLYPNPFSDHFELRFNSKENILARLAVVDMTGRVIYEQEYRISNGSNNIRINELNQAPSGIYFLRLESGSSVITAKLIRQ